MAARSWLSRPGLLHTLLGQGRLALRLLREPRVPMVSKSVPVLAALYVISPVDLLPDFIPVLGQLDDLGIILLGMQLFVRICPPAATAFHQRAIAARRRFSPMAATDDFIDAEWKTE